MRLLLAFCLFVWPYAVTAQSTSAASVTVDPAIAAQHLKTGGAPNYPPIAKAAHVSGAVTLQLTIDATGQVISTKTISGPPMLVGAAIDCVKKWVYEPFESNGQPVSATTTVTVPFSLGTTADPNDEKIAAIYFPLSAACNRSLAIRHDPAKAVQACKAAADEAEKFSTNDRFNERCTAFVYAATAFTRNRQNKEALVYADRAVALVQQGHGDLAGTAGVYGTRAQSRALAGDLAGAEQDAAIAEDAQRKALDTPAGREAHTAYAGTLRNIMRFHSQLLSALGKNAEAKAKLDEAEKL